MSTVPQALKVKHKEHWLCLRFTSFALNLAGFRAETKQAFVVSFEDRVWQLSQGAKDKQVDASMSINQMLLLTQHTQYQERDRELESLRLDELAYWAYSFTSQVVIFNERTLLLEVGKSATLFNGLPNLIQRCKSQIEGFGYDVALNTASTPKAAYLLSYQPFRDTELEDPELHNQEKTQLAQTELSTLPVPPRTLAQLRQCGFRSLGDIAEIPAKELGSRFGLKFIDYLDQLYGHAVDPQLPTLPPQRFSQAVAFDEPIYNTQWMEKQQQQLLLRLCNFAHKANLLYQHVHWFFWTNSEHYVETQIEVDQTNIISRSIEKQVEDLLELTKLRLEALKIEHGINNIELNCDAFLPITLCKQDLFNPTPEHHAYQRLHQALVARLGHKAVYQFEVRDEHLPEESYVKISESRQSTPNKYQTNDAEPTQPCWLFERAKPLSQRDGKPYHKGPLEMLYGPHRVVHRWWLDLQSRDYFVAKQADGQLLWIYLDRVSKRWYLHGLYG